MSKIKYENISVMFNVFYTIKGNMQIHIKRQPIICRLILYILFIHSRDLLGGASGPATAKKRFKRLIECGQLVPGNKCSSSGSTFPREGPTIEKARRRLKCELFEPEAFPTEDRRAHKARQWTIIVT